MREALGVAAVGMGGALLVACAVAGCGESANNAAPAVDARLGLAELTEPFECPDTAKCTQYDREEPFSLRFETPENIELQPEQSGLLGYDSAAKQFVAYGMEADRSPSPNPPLLRAFEQLRFHASYDRVQLGGGAALACAGRTCDFFELYADMKALRVPDEVSGRWLDGRCVGGTGSSARPSRRWSGLGARRARPSRHRSPSS